MNRPDCSDAIRTISFISFPCFYFVFSLFFPNLILIFLSLSFLLSFQFFNLLFFHISVETISPKVFASLMNDDAAQAKQRDEVWYGHQGVHAVGDVPNQAETDDASYVNADDVEHTIAEHPSLSFEIFHASFSIIAPSQGGTEGKCGKSDGEQRSANIRYLAKSRLG